MSIKTFRLHVIPLICRQKRFHTELNYPTTIQLSQNVQLRYSVSYIQPNLCVRATNHTHTHTIHAKAQTDVTILARTHVRWLLSISLTAVHSAIHSALVSSPRALRDNVAGLQSCARPKRLSMDCDPHRSAVAGQRFYIGTVSALLPQISK